MSASPIRRVALLLLALLPAACADGPPAGEGESAAEAAPAAPPLEAPRLHHVHLNSTDPGAAAAWYAALWPEGEVGEMAGHVAFLADMAVLFTEVDAPPPGAWDAELQRSEPQSAFWHFGGFRNTTGFFRQQEERGETVLRLWTGPDDREGVRRSGLAPYAGIRTAAALDTVTHQVPRDGGFGYLEGPDGALVEVTGGPSTELSFSHVHLYHEEPACAARWYVEHLGMTLPPVRDAETGEARPGTLPEPCAGLPRGEPGWPSLEHAGTIRSPSARVVYEGGSISMYPRQCTEGRCGGARPLVPSRGQVLDHVAFRVEGLDARLERLREEGVRILEGPYAFGEGRAALVEGPDGLALELVELP